MNYIEFLKDAILKTHGVESEYSDTVPVYEVYEGKTVWQGNAEVFAIRRTPQNRHLLCLGIYR